MKQAILKTIFLKKYYDIIKEIEYKKKKSKNAKIKIRGVIL